MYKQKQILGTLYIICTILLSDRSFWINQQLIGNRSPFSLSSARSRMNSYLAMKRYTAAGSDCPVSSTTHNPPILSEIM